MATTAGELDNAAATLDEGVEMTGGELIAAYLIREKVPYVVGIPGHGILPTVDAFVDRKDRVTALQAVHEQGAARAEEVLR